MKTGLLIYNIIIVKLCYFKEILPFAVLNRPSDHFTDKDKIKRFSV